MSKQEKEIEADPKRIKDLIKMNEEEKDFLEGATCNPNNPEDCESCQ